MQSDSLEERIRMIAKAEIALRNQIQTPAPATTPSVDDARLKKLISDLERKMSETTQSISVVQQSLQKLSTENTNLKREVEDLQKRQSPEERIRQLEKEVDELSRTALWLKYHQAVSFNNLKPHLIG